jgi:hypothetical protein
MTGEEMDMGAQFLAIGLMALVSGIVFIPLGNHPQALTLIALGVLGCGVSLLHLKRVVGGS